MPQLLNDPGFELAQTGVPGWTYGRYATPMFGYGHGSSKVACLLGTMPAGLLTSNESSMETPAGVADISGWTASSACSIATATVAADGQRSLAMTITGPTAFPTTSAYARTAAKPVGTGFNSAIGAAWVATARVRSATLPRNCFLVIFYYSDAAGTAFISQSTTYATSSTQGWTNLYLVSFPPANALSFAAVVGVQDGNSTVGEVHYWDMVNVNPFESFFGARPQANLLPPFMQSFETGEAVATYYQAPTVAGCTLAVTSTAGGDGGHQLQMTRVGAVAAQILTLGYNAAPGDWFTYTASVTVPAGVTEDVRLVIAYFSAPGVQIGAYYSPARSVVGPATVAVQMGYTAPATTTLVQAGVYSAAGVNGDIMYVDGQGLWRGATDYRQTFSAANAYLANGLSAGPIIGPGINLLSMADALALAGYTWVAGAATTLALDTVKSTTGGSSFKLTAAAGANGISQPTASWVPVVGGQHYSANAYAFLTLTATKTVTTTLTFYDASGATVDTVSTAFSAVTATQPVLLEVMGMAPPGAAWAAMSITWTGAVGDIIQLDQLAIMPGIQVRASDWPVNGVNTAVISSWTMPNPTLATVSQTVTVTPGSMYALTAFVRPQAITRAMCQIVWLLADGVTRSTTLPTTVWLLDVSPSLGQWTGIASGPINAPADAVKAQIVFSAGVLANQGYSTLGLQGPAGLYVDNVYFGAPQTTTDEFWMIDGNNLNNLAYNIETLSGTGNMPAKRGANYQAPYKRGEAWTRKYADPAKITLAMWLNDSDPVGNRPAFERDRRAQLNANETALRSMLAVEQRQLSVAKLQVLTGGAYLMKTALGEAKAMTVSYDADFGREFAKAAVDLELADPYWYGPAQSVLLTVAPTTPYLPYSGANPITTATANGLAMSDTTGQQVTTVNPGSVRTSKVYATILGPFPNGVLITNVTTGSAIGSTEAIGSGWVIDLDCDNFNAVGPSNATIGPPSAYLIHSGGREWMTLDPGPNIINIGASSPSTQSLNQGSTSAVIITYFPAYEA